MDTEQVMNWCVEDELTRKESDKGEADGIKHKASPTDWQGVVSRKERPVSCNKEDLGSCYTYGLNRDLVMTIVTLSMMVKTF